jgi:hypothetical protein
MREQRAGKHLQYQAFIFRKEIIMKTFLHIATLSSAALLSSLATGQSNMNAPHAATSASAQMSQDMSPQMRAQLARREAHAAYNEALRACRSMERSERKGCMTEAKRNLQSDLSYAKEIRNPQTSAGASGGADSGSGAMSNRGSGASGLVTGMSDLSTSGSSGGSASGTQGSSMQGGRRESGMSAEPLSAAEKKQFVQSFTPKAQYNLAKREAHAAYAEALKACKELDRAERSACTEDARAMLRNDLAYAKDQMQAGSSAGAMGGSDKEMSGSGR